MTRENQSPDLEIIFLRNRVGEFLDALEAGEEIDKIRLLTAWDDVLHLGRKAPKGVLKKIEKLGEERNLIISTETVHKAIKKLNGKYTR